MYNKVFKAGYDFSQEHRNILKKYILHSIHYRENITLILYDLKNVECLTAKHLYLLKK